MPHDSFLPASQLRGNRAAQVPAAGGLSHCGVRELQQLPRVGLGMIRKVLGDPDIPAETIGRHRIGGDRDVLRRSGRAGSQREHPQLLRRSQQGAHVPLFAPLDVRLVIGVSGRRDRPSEIRVGPDPQEVVPPAEVAVLAGPENLHQEAILNVSAPARVPQESKEQPIHVAHRRASDRPSHRLEQDISHRRHRVAPASVAEFCRIQSAKSAKNRSFSELYSRMCVASGYVTARMTAGDLRKSARVR